MAVQRDNPYPNHNFEVSIVGVTDDNLGFSEVVFQPCADRPRTVWPGGIRVEGTKPVRLLVQAEGSSPVPLVLGKPRVRR